MMLELLWAPMLSVTVRVTGQKPVVAKACDAVTPDAVEPSPKFQTYDVMKPSGSYDPEPSKKSGVNVCANCAAPALATGDWFGPLPGVTVTTLLGADFPEELYARILYLYVIPGATESRKLVVLGDTRAMTIQSPDQGSLTATMYPSASVAWFCQLSWMVGPETTVAPRLVGARGRACAADQPKKSCATAAMMIAIQTPRRGPSGGRFSRRGDCGPSLRATGRV